MTERELKRLNRSDLLEMLLNLSQENETLRIRLAEAEEKLSEREVAIANVGSLAEAALQLNGVFTAAQAACDQYLENIRSRSANQEAICARMERETREKCDRMILEAKLQADAYQQETQQAIEKALAKHGWLFDLIGAPGAEAKQDEGTHG